jgi:protein-L-isoaspartate(D-aspartate) O-methyltransferase
MGRRPVILLIALVILGTLLAMVVLVGGPAGTRRDQAQLDDASFDEARARMVEDGVVGWGIDDPVVIEAMATVPRHRFVPSEYLGQAYENHPLPIGYGQTISQPYIVA